MANAHLPKYHRVSFVGNRLVDGPFSIKPPPEVDDYGWLECAFRIIHVEKGVAESAAVYVDDSTNREEEFLPALVRSLVWKREDDSQKALRGEISWPSAIPTLAYVGQATAAVHQVIGRMEEHLRSLPYVPWGLWTDRSSPDVDIDGSGRTSVFVSNGLQQVEYHAKTERDREFIKDALDGLRILQGIGPSIPLRDWRESYDVDLTSEGTGLWRWNYEAQG